VACAELQNQGQPADDDCSRHGSATDRMCEQRIQAWVAVAVTTTVLQGPSHKAGLQRLLNAWSWFSSPGSSHWQGPPPGGPRLPLA